MADDSTVKLTKLESEISTINRDIATLNTAVHSIDRSLHTLLVLEEKTNQILKALQEASDKTKDLEDRLRIIENEMPQLRMLSKYAITAIVAVLGLVGAAILKTVGIG